MLPGEVAGRTQSRMTCNGLNAWQRTDSPEWKPGSRQGSQATMRGNGPAQGPWMRIGGVPVTQLTCAPLLTPLLLPSLWQGLIARHGTKTAISTEPTEFGLHGSAKCRARLPS